MIESSAISTPEVPRKLKQVKYSILQIVSGNLYASNHEAYHLQNA